MSFVEWIKGVLAVSVLVLAGAAQAAEQGVSKIVMFDESVPAAARAAAIAKAGGQVVKEFAFINAVEAVFPETKAFHAEGFGSADAGIAKGREGVASVELNAVHNWLVQSPAAMRSVAMPAVADFLRHGAVAAPAVGPSAAVDGGTENGVPWGVARVHASAAWERSRMGEGVKVGVIDTGIDGTHPALKANYKGGFNAVTAGGDPNDDHGHGTHVAGTIAAASPEVVGVAPKASLYGIKVLDAKGNGSYASIIAGLQWAVDNRMNVVNMSLGGPPSEALEAAVKKTLAAGVSIIAAAGNDPKAEVSAPGRYDGVIAVSASTAQDGIASFSTTGKQVAFIAPGYQVPSTWPGGGMKTLSGTSMATPHVTGLAVLAIAMGARGPTGVRQALDAAAAPLDGLNQNQQGGGMIDAGRLAAPRVASR